MATFVYPTQQELTAIAQEKMPRLTVDRLGFSVMPIAEKDHHLLAWEQLDNYLGLQQVRGMDGMPSRVRKVGAKRFAMEPGVYGEFIDIDEQELTSRRRLGTWDGQIDITDMVMLAQDQLLQRRLDRIETIIWTLLSTGTFSVAGPTGNILHTDTYTTQTFVAGITWATTATAVPLANLRAVKLLGRGKGVRFGNGARAYMNQTTANDLFNNTNSADFGGRYSVLANTVRSLETANRILIGEDLPQIEIYDEGYLDDAGTFQLFIPNNKVVVIGQRPAGQTVGEYRLTRNANNPGMSPGAYMKVVDHGELVVPRRIDVHDGHNGGPILYFPSAIVIMTV
jgi:hypothetical protein